MDDRIIKHMQPMKYNVDHNGCLVVVPCEEDDPEKIGHYIEDGDSPESGKIKLTDKEQFRLLGVRYGR